MFLTFGSVAALLLFAPMRDVVLRFVHDDAFYYFGIARRWHRLGFSTFDGLNPTNGYHPLWQWLLVPAAGLFRDPAIFARVFSASGTVLIAAAAWLVRRRLVRDGNPHADLSFYWTGGALAFATIYGMEAPLAAFCLATTLALVPRTESDWTARRAASLGVASAFLFLARIDSLAGIVALDGLLLLSFLRVRGAVPKLASAAAIQAAVIGANFLYNLHSWGHLLPISAALKEARAGWFSFAFPRNFLLMLSIPATVAGAALLLDFLRALFRRGARSERLPSLAAAWLGLADLIALAQIAAKGSAETYNWYFVPAVLSGAYLFPAALARFKGSYSGAALRRAFIGACLLCLAINLRGKILKPGNFVDAYDGALALSAFPSDSLVLASNDCGVLGYFSNQHVMNLDGLTNSFEFQRSLEKDDLTGWLKTCGLNAFLEPYAQDRRLANLTASLTTRRSLNGPARSVLIRLKARPLIPPTIAPSLIDEAPGSAGFAVWGIAGIEPPSR